MSKKTPFAKKNAFFSRFSFDKTQNACYSNGLDAQNCTFFVLRRIGILTEYCAYVAQLVEHILGKDEVTSSTLVIGSIFDNSKH